MMPLPGCVICDTITHMIHTRVDEEFRASIQITEAEDAVSWNCGAHKPVLSTANVHDTDFINRGKVLLGKHPGSPVFWVGKTALHLFRRDSVPHHCGMRRLISDPAWIDLDLIRGFLDNYKRNNGRVCQIFLISQATAALQLPRPSFLIDLHASRIVPAHQSWATNQSDPLAMSETTKAHKYTCRSPRPTSRPCSNPARLSKRRWSGQTPVASPPAPRLSSPSVRCPVTTEISRSIGAAAGRPTPYGRVARRRRRRRDESCASRWAVFSGFAGPLRRGRRPAGPSSWAGCRWASICGSRTRTSAAGRDRAVL